MPTPTSKLQSISRRTKIPYKILEEVYKKSVSKTPKDKRSPAAKAKSNIDYFIRDGCSFKLYPEIVNKAIRQMSQSDVKSWCGKQIKN